MRFPLFDRADIRTGAIKTERRSGREGGERGERKLRSKHFCWVTHAGVNEANFCIAFAFTESEFG